MKMASRGIRKYRKQSGFTLTELMIVVAIIAILAAVAYPQYGKYAMRAKRSEGRSYLLDAAARLERYYSDNNRYAAAANTIHSDTGISANSESGYYTISLASTGTFQTYTLTATPVAPFVDAECGALTYTNAGVKGENGTGSVSDCWGK